LTSYLIVSDYLLVVKKNKIFTMYARYMISEVQKILCQGNTFMRILDNTIMQVFASTLHIAAPNWRSSNLLVMRPAVNCAYSTLYSGFSLQQFARMSTVIRFIVMFLDKTIWSVLGKLSVDCFRWCG
jgi:hypothetical protein